MLRAPGSRIHPAHQPKTPQSNGMDHWARTKKPGRFWADRQRQKASSSKPSHTTHVCTFLPVRYWRLAELAAEIDQQHQDVSATNDLVKQIAKYHLVIFDDFFTTEISTHATRVLFEIMEARTGQATAIVSQLGAADWGKMMPNNVTAESLINRILHPSMTVILNAKKTYAKPTSHEKTSSLTHVPAQHKTRGLPPHPHFPNPRITLSNQQKNPFQPPPRTA